MAAIVTSENYLDSSMRNITNITKRMMASFKQKSAVFDYFKMPDYTSGKYRAKCKHCTTTVTTCGMTTSNILIHLNFLVSPSVLIDT